MDKKTIKANATGASYEYEDGTVDIEGKHADGTMVSILMSVQDVVDFVNAYKEIVWSESTDMKMYRFKKQIDDILAIKNPIERLKAANKALGGKPYFDAYAESKKKEKKKENKDG